MLPAIFNFSNLRNKHWKFLLLKNSLSFVALTNFVHSNKRFHRHTKICDENAKIETKITDNKSLFLYTWSSATIGFSYNKKIEPELPSWRWLL